MKMQYKTLQSLEKSIIRCEQCPRLVAWRELVSEKKRKAFQSELYWGKPVAGFGDEKAEVLVVGLAPGAHGSNRTGRMFTGDASGDFLFPALYKAGFSSSPEGKSRNDGLQLKKIFITAVCRCVPPKNRPNREETDNCKDFLIAEMQILQDLVGVVVLGQIAFNAMVDIFRDKFSLCISSRPKFSHNEFFHWEGFPYWMISSYHPSRQNTQTGKLTERMFDDVWDLCKRKINYE